MTGMLKNNLVLRILIIGKVWPEPDSSAAGSRMMQLITAMIEYGWDVYFGSPAAKSSWSIDLENKGVDVVGIELNNSSFDHVITSLDPDVVIFDRFMIEEQFGWRVAEQCPGALRILDTEDLHCLRHARQNAVDSEDDEKNLLLREKLTKREIASILRCDLSLIISEYELRLLKEIFGIKSELLHYLPFLLDQISKEDASELPDFDARSHYITIGNFAHDPNVDSVMYLKHDIWPFIRQKLPSAEMHVYGAYPNQKVYDLNDSETGFKIKGRVKDAGKVMRNARICLAPLRFGAGLKGKLIESMTWGTPSVTTSIGAEGITEPSGWSGFVEDDPQRFAASAVRLYTDRKLWEKSQKRGIAIINNRFNKNEFVRPWLERILELKENLEDHRLKNFTGAMLLHHTTASSKFMSKWIEEKNS